MGETEYIIGGHLKKGDEQGLIFSVALWGGIWNELIEFERIPTGHQDEYKVVKNLGPVFSVFCNSGYWTSLNQRWEFLKNQGAHWSALAQITSPAAMMASGELLEELAGHVSPELEKMIKTVLRVDFKAPRVLQSALMDYFPKPQKNINLGICTSLEANLQAMFKLEKDLIRYFKGKITLRISLSHLKACKYQRQKEVSGIAVWSVQKTTGMGESMASAVRPHLYLERTIEEEEAERAAHARFLVREALGSGHDPELERYLPDKGIFIDEDNIRIYAFGLVSKLQMETESPVLVSIYQKLLNECDGCLNTFEDCIVEHGRRFIVDHEVGHFKNQRKAGELIKEVTEKLGFSWCEDLTSYIEETLADMWAFEHLKHELSESFWNTQILLGAIHISGARLAKEWKVVDVVYYASNLQTVLALQTNDPAGYLMQEMGKVMEKARILDTQEKLEQWFLGWHEANREKVCKWAYNS